MGKLNLNQVRDEHITVLSMSSLKQLYVETIEELQVCSEIKPEGTTEDAEHDLREGALLDFESFLLRRASKVPLRSDTDINSLMDIWSKASGVDRENPRPSDKIAMNIFRHLCSDSLKA